MYASPAFVFQSSAPASLTNSTMRVACDGPRPLSLSFPCESSVALSPRRLLCILAGNLESSLSADTCSGLAAWTSPSVRVAPTYGGIPQQCQQLVLAVAGEIIADVALVRHIWEDDDPRLDIRFDTALGNLLGVVASGGIIVRNDAPLELW